MSNGQKPQEETPGLQKNTHTKYAHPYISSQRKNKELWHKRSKNIHSIPNTVEMLCNIK